MRLCCVPESEEEEEEGPGVWLARLSSRQIREEIIEDCSGKGNKFNLSLGNVIKRGDIRYSIIY